MATPTIQTQTAALVLAITAFGNAKLNKLKDTIASYRETVTLQAVTNAASSIVDCSKANIVKLTLNINATLSFSNVPPANTGGYSLTLIIAQGTGNNTVTFPNNITWEGGTPPVLSTVAGKRDYVTLVTIDGGATWDGFISGSGRG